MREDRYLLIVRSMSSLRHWTRAGRVHRPTRICWTGPIGLGSLDCWRSRFVHEFFGIGVEFRFPSDLTLIFCL